MRRNAGSLFVTQRPNANPPTNTANAIEEIERAHGAHANEVKQRALDAQIGERLMQALEDSICANWLLLLF